MSVLLQGLSMPKGNPRTIILYRDGTWCDAYNGKAVEVPVPPHGRLIDADALDVIGYCGIPKGREDTFDDGVMWLAEQIDLLPTIIPAERSE